MPEIPPLGGLARFTRFLMVGAIGFVVDAGISNAVVAALHVSAFLARLPAFATATIVTYALNRIYTFKDRRLSFWTGWLRYITATTSGALVNYGVFSLLIVTILRGHAAIVEAIAAGSLAGLAFNYIWSTRFVFRDSHQDNPVDIPEKTR